MAKKRDLFSLLLKIVFSFSIIILIVLKKAPLREIGDSLKEASLWWICLSFSLHSFGLLISAIRWQILIKAQGDHAPLGYLAKSYLAGNFFNLFLPTRFGGDVVRVWDGSKPSKSLLKSTAIVLVERLTGIIVLLCFALGVSLFRLDVARELPVVWISLAVGLLGLTAILSFFHPFSARLIGLLPERGVFSRIKEKIFEFRKIILIYRDKKPALFKALFWAFLLQVNVILHYYFVGKALSINIPFFDYFIFIPIVLLILTIPVTINGLGLREILYISVFALYGISSSGAVSFSVIADIAFTLIIGILGGIIYAFRR
jgi:uncharacterized protein (TIRG00374 family)